MAEQGENDDRTEEATPERREDFRKKGQVAMILSVLGIVTTIVLGLGFILVFYSKDTSS